MNFFSYAGDVTVQVVIMFLLILVGFAAAKAHWMDGRGVPQLVNILFYIVTPAVIIHAFVSSAFTQERALSLLEMTGCAILVHLIGYFVSKICFHREGAFKKPVLQMGTIFSNCGFMSLPLAAALLGTDGVFYVSVYVVVHNVIVWTLGVSLFENARMSVRKALFNPGTIGVLIGLPLFFLKVNVPEVLSAPISYLYDLNTPLAMLVIGFYISETTLRVQKGDGKILFSILLRLAVIPAIALAVFRLLPIRAEVLMACMVPASAPAAANVPMFADLFDSDVDAASRIMSVSTLFSIVTMPVFLSLAQMAA